MRLNGNFDSACFKDCEISILNLTSGSFRGMDLTGAALGDLQLHMDDVDIDDIQLPEELGIVRFFWVTKRRDNSFCTSRDYALHVLDAWNSAGKCEALATHAYNRVRASGPKQNARGLKIMRSRGQTLDGVSGKQLLERDDLALLAGLIARRNQLAAGRRANVIKSGLPSAAQHVIAPRGDPVTELGQPDPETP